MDAGGLGRFLMMLGVILLVAGALVAFGPRLPWIGRLPGDFVWGGERWKVYFPLATSLLLSILLTLILRLWFRK